MGFDMSYQAVPADCGLLERARADVEFGESLCLLPLWLRNGHGPPPGRWPAADALWLVAQQLIRQHPGLEKRNCYLDRWWDKLHYLLSANRRGSAGTTADGILDRAVRGGNSIADHIRAPQGQPVRFVAPGEVVAAAELLGALAPEKLFEFYSPQKMEEAGVYKFATGHDDRDREYLPQYLDALRRFYRDAAEHGEGVLVSLD